MTRAQAALEAGEILTMGYQRANGDIDARLSLTQDRKTAPRRSLRLRSQRYSGDLIGRHHAVILPSCSLFVGFGAADAEPPST